MLDLDATPRSSSAPATTSWLPEPRQPPLLTKPMNMNNIRSLKDRDWFMCLADAIDELQNDQLQCRLLGKMYFFMRDVLSRGLVGDFAHIDGDQVMHYLLSYTGESSASRHKVSRDADTAWIQLERWKKGNNWREALELAKAASSNHNKTRQKMPWKVPGLLSPAGMLAVLILAYPDPKYKHRIEQLEIQFMLEPRELLHVRHGFWSGINHGNLHHVFQTEEPRRSEVAFLADYSLLFGRNSLNVEEISGPIFVNGHEAVL
ncbi:hypothetical protein F5B17DRAFT_423012, partial [Nemania serpens]